MREWQIYRKKTGSNSYQINKQTLLRKFTGLMHISSRVIRRYLGMLTPWISIYLEKGEKYYITFQKNAVIAPRSDSENGELREHDIRVDVYKRQANGRFPEGSDLQDLGENAFSLS